MKLTRKHEIGAALLCSAVLVGGILLGWKFDPAWLNRAGSVIIVIGIVTGAIRIRDLLNARISKMMNHVFPNAMAAARAAIEEESKRRFTDEEAQSIDDKVKADTERALAEAARRWAEGEGKALEARFKRFELTMLIVGTLVNGFGDWILKLIGLTPG